MTAITKPAGRLPYQAPEISSLDLETSHNVLITFSLRSDVEDFELDEWGEEW